jgi:hypothetical protein
MNKDGVEDILLWDNTNVYLKYGKQSATFAGPKGTTTTFFSKKVDHINPQEPFLVFDTTTRLKIADYHEEVKNFITQGQTFDSIALSWRKSREEDVEGYLIQLTERIDHSPEKTTAPKKYLLVLPRGTELSSTTQLQLPTTTNRLEQLLSNQNVIEVQYFDPNRASISVIIEKVERKRQYARIVTLRNENNSFLISSPRSNQIVAGKQVLGDDQGPQGEAHLLRIQTQESVSSGDSLEGFVGTQYSVIIDREDNVALAHIEAEVEGTIVKSLETTKKAESISIDNLFFTGATTQRYLFRATDQEGNSTTKEVTLTISIPNITITSIEKNTETTATITAELSQDVDEGTVSFQKNRNGYRDALVAENQGKKIEHYPLKPKLTTITGQYYQINDTV